MKKTVKTSDANACYKLLNDARLGNISDTAKLDVLRVLRALRPLAKELEEEHTAALGKLKPDGYEQRVKDAQRYEAELKDGKTPTMTASQYVAVVQEIRQYESDVRRYDTDLLAQEVEINIPALSEDVLVELMTANDLTAGQLLAVEDVCRE